MGTRRASMSTRTFIGSVNEYQKDQDDQTDNKTHPIRDASRMAEREGFEPSIPFRGIPDFESGAFDHSATSPWRWRAKSAGECYRSTRRGSRLPVFAFASSMSRSTNHPNV